MYKNEINNAPLGVPLRLLSLSGVRGLCNVLRRRVHGAVHGSGTVHNDAGRIAVLCLRGGKL